MKFKIVSNVVFFVAVVLQLNIKAFDKISINTDTIKIYLDNKDSALLINNKSGGESSVMYSYLGYWPKIKLHKYYPKLYEFSGNYFLINNRDGRKYEFYESEPKYNNELNPRNNLDFIASVKDDGHGPSKINIYEVKDTLKLVYTKEVKPDAGWYFSDLHWSSPTSFFVKKVYNSQNFTNIYTEEQIELINNKWVYIEKIGFNEKGEVDSIKTNNDK